MLVCPFSVLVCPFAVSALLRRPLVSRLRSAAFTARGSGGFRRWASPSVSAFAAGRVDLRAHDFRFSACAASEIAARRVGLRAHGFRFSARTASGLPLGGLALPPSASGLPLGGLTFGLTASAFWHAPLRSCRSAGWFFCLPLRGCPRRVGLRTHRFRFSARTASELPSASWFFFLPLLRWPLGGLAFGFTTSAFRHAPLRGCPRRVGSSAFRFGDCRSAG